MRQRLNLLTTPGTWPRLWLIKTLSRIEPTGLCDAVTVSPAGRERPPPPPARDTPEAEADQPAPDDDRRCGGDRPGAVAPEGCRQRLFELLEERGWTDIRRIDPAR